MAKKKTESEQMDLINVQPENANAIVEAARLYFKFQAARLAALAKEVKQKQRVLELIKAAGLQRLDGGKIKFKHNNVEISVTPRDELIQIKDNAESE